jgi:hypothetical protein
MIDVELKVALAYFGFGVSFTSVESWAEETSQQLNPETTIDNIFFITLILILMFVDLVYLLRLSCS